MENLQAAMGEAVRELLQEVKGKTRTYNEAFRELSAQKREIQFHPQSGQVPS